MNLIYISLNNNNGSVMCQMELHFWKLSLVGLLLEHCGPLHKKNHLKIGDFTVICVTADIPAVYGIVHCFLHISSTLTHCLFKLSSYFCVINEIVHINSCFIIDCAIVSIYLRCIFSITEYKIQNKCRLYVCLKLTILYWHLGLLLQHSALFLMSVCTFYDSSEAVIAAFFCSHSSSLNYMKHLWIWFVSGKVLLHGFSRVQSIAGKLSEHVPS